MPIYEYQCDQCGRRIEVMQRITEEPLTDCSCGGKGTLHRLISLTSFQLKGTGWYATDFKGGGSGGNGGSGGKRHASEKTEKKDTENESSAAASASEEKTKSTPAGEDKKNQPAATPSPSTT